MIAHKLHPSIDTASPPAAPVLWDCIAQTSDGWRTTVVEARTAFEARRLATVELGADVPWVGVKCR